MYKSIASSQSSLFLLFRHMHAVSLIMTLEKLRIYNNAHKKYTVEREGGEGGERETTCVDM